MPQDNRFQVKNADNSYTDIRVSIMPSIHGEKIVLRLQATSKGILDLEKTGIRGQSYKRLRDALSKTQGIILVTGPTGSGKTQTLASSLKILNTSKVNIITLEDPVEIKIDGINQVQVNAEVGLTFASGLRSILRQDPDVIMVGEIRDSETAALAVQAALVGRLVMATLHTNSAAGAFVRLIDMGIEPFLLSSTVNIVEAQRLVRVLCKECKQPYEASPEVIETIHKELDPLNGINIYDDEKKLRIHFDKNTKNATLHKAVGCPQCNQTGYASRSGIFECLVISEGISKLILEKASISSINEKAISEGMMTMIQDGFIKVLEGITTLEEVMRVRNE
ncbi:MAG: GspE/PulE family protein [Candidatus Dojkabacteria bacterium]|nr:GspE/PulE family protein [Candidatus Dojkabacteria bacterium]